MDKILNYMYHIIITIIVVIIGMIIVKTNNSSKLVKIDLVAVTSYFTQVITKDSLVNPENSIKANNSEIIKTNLQPLLDDYAKTHHVIIIQSQVLISGNIPDITNIIINQLQEKIQ